MSFIAGAILISAGVAAAAGVTTSAINANRAKKEGYRQESIANTQAEMLAELESTRPDFKNPYENMQNQFKDLNNPYANLTVATEAFKMEAEQADQALANSLDVMMETGQAAGGATALAQAALQSKRDTMEQGDAINFHEKKMNRAAGLMENAQQNNKDAQAARSAAIAGIGDSVAQGASIAAGAAPYMGGNSPK